MKRRVVRVPGIKKNDKCYVVDCIKIYEGRRLHIYSSGYKSLEEAKIAKEQLIKDKIDSYRELKGTGVNINQLIYMYDEYRSFHIRYSSRRYEKSILMNSFSKYMTCDVGDILTNQIIKKMYVGLLSKSATEAWKNRAFGVLRRFINFAYKNKLISLEKEAELASIFENLPENRKVFKEKHIWNKEEIKLFFDSIDNEVDKLLFTLALVLGARVSELAGLTWDCYDHKNNYITIKQQLINLGNHRYELSSQLKTSQSYRVCKIDKNTANLLNRYKKRTNGRGYIFKSIYRIGDPMSKDQIRSRLNKYIKKSGVSQISMHAFRHMKATEFLKVCKDMEELKAAAKFLGHSVSMLLEIYGHASLETTDKIAKRINYQYIL